MKMKPRVKGKNLKNRKKDYVDNLIKEADIEHDALEGFQGGAPPVDWEEMELLEEIYADINIEKAPRISKRRVKEHLVMH